MLSRQFSIIVAATATTKGIGINGSIPWQVDEDKQFFKTTTTTTQNPNSYNVVIMGRKTWDSLPKKFKPLPDRINIVITRQPDVFQKDPYNQSLMVKPMPIKQQSKVQSQLNPASVKSVNIPTSAIPATTKTSTSISTIKTSTPIVSSDFVGDVSTEPQRLYVVQSLNQSLELLCQPPLKNAVENVFVIGGGEIYTAAINHPSAAMLYLTDIISPNFECDKFFPPIDSQWQPIRITNHVQTKPDGIIQYQFKTYRRNNLPTFTDEKSSAFVFLPSSLNHTNSTKSLLQEDGKIKIESSATTSTNVLIDTTKDSKHQTTTLANTNTDIKNINNDNNKTKENNIITENIIKNEEEEQYLSLIRNILATGSVKSDRTGVGTISKFGAQMRFSLRDGRFPLLTTKQVYWKGVVEELLWMLRGCTDSQSLSAKKVKIWDDNGSRTFLDKLGFQHREVGDLGPVYGFQWRHFGATYIDSKTDYKGQGVDQIAEVMHQIKTNPDSRRILLSAWNPKDLKLMALPPCHFSAQFYVDKGELSCLMNQRSADVGLGLPFNIASYALLTVLMAHACELKPGELVHTLGDYHVYQNHIEPLKEQLKRIPRTFPTLKIAALCQPKKDLAMYTIDDLELSDYKPYPSVKMTMAV